MLADSQYPKCQHLGGGMDYYFLWEEVELSYGNSSSKFVIVGMKIQSFVTKVIKWMYGSAKHRLGLTSSPVDQSTLASFNLIWMWLEWEVRVSSCSENYIKMLLLKCEFDSIDTQVPEIKTSGQYRVFLLSWKLHIESKHTFRKLCTCSTDKKWQGWLQACVRVTCWCDLDVQCTYILTEAECIWCIFNLIYYCLFAKKIRGLHSVLMINDEVYIFKNNVQFYINSTQIVWE